MSTALALTKFRVPRTRRDLVRRDVLLAQLRQHSRQHPVTLIVAPAGSGKTTLMLQFAAAAEPDEACVWIALDDDDNHPSRLLATLVRSLLPLNLSWDTDPLALVANVSDAGSEARAVLAGIVNALCTTTASRVSWLLDDLHRIGDRATVALLDALIERLPEHVSLLFGSRSEPALPLARLRAHGELGEIDAAQLRFDESTVSALAQQRWGSEPSPALVREALQRSQGWAVGVNLLLIAQAAKAQGALAAPNSTAPRGLFEFLAQEVLDELPGHLRRFAIDCAVLPELDPRRCRAVSQREDSRVLLDELLRRHLFLTVIEDSEPVLRFHDLFRDFLLEHLALEPASHRSDCYARAAAVETVPERAIAHWLDAQHWTEAAELIAGHGLRLAGEGGYASLERWLRRLPADIAQQPRLALLMAECAWSRWDWEQVVRHAEPAAAGLANDEELPQRLRAQLLLAASLGALGRLQERADLTERCFESPLPPSDAAQFHLQRAWSAFSLGDCDRIASHLAAMNDRVAEHPAQYAPQLAPTLNCHFGGLPGVTEAYLRFAALCESVPRPAAAPWHSTPVVIAAWAALWQGRREGAARAFERAEQIQQRFGKVRYVLLDAKHLQALMLAIDGDFERSRQGLETLLSDLESSDAQGLRRAWQRPYRSVLARICWMAMDREGLAQQAALLDGAPRDREWPLVQGAIATVRGQAALLAGDLPAARAALELALQHHAQHPAPAFYADPRIAMAQLHETRGDRARAWQVFEPVLREILRDGTPGRLLLEPAAVVRRLLQLAPAGMTEAAYLLATLAHWQGDAPAATAHVLTTPANGIAQKLSERERQVIELVALGLSNKQLARQLALSLHTVKRHLANILDKLGCDNRGQAADLWRRAQG